MSASERDRELASSRGGFEVWALWTLASAVGGAAGGATFVMQFFGVVFLFGLVLGAAQALILWPYFREAAGPWVAASVVGWIAGWMVFLLVRALANLVEMPGIAQRAGAAIDQLAGSATASTVLLGPLVVWIVFAASQGATLALVALAFGRRSMLLLAALWPLAGTLGGALAVTASYYLSNTTALQYGGGFFLNETMPLIAGLATAGALYGAATGLVLAMIARRSPSQEDSTR